MNITLRGSTGDTHTNWLGIKPYFTDYTRTTGHTCLDAPAGH